VHGTTAVRDRACRVEPIAPALVGDDGRAVIVVVVAVGVHVPELDPRLRHRRAVETHDDALDDVTARADLVAHRRVRLVVGGYVRACRRARGRRGKG
jgi:hypothetical protein